MSIFETFSKRLRRQKNAGKADVFQYNTLPDHLRRQIIMIWTASLGPFRDMRHIDRYDDPPASNEFWRVIHDILAKGLGEFYLGLQRDDPFIQCQQFFMSASTEHALDLIEISFIMINGGARSLDANAMRRSNITQQPDDAILELNYRFKEHGIGYEFVKERIIRIDSQLMHAETILPTLNLLADHRFTGAEEEFLKAHEHLRQRRYKEAIADSLKSLESTLKTIFDKKGWSYPKGATAKPLLDIAFDKHLIPEELTSHFSGLRAALEGGLPTLRNAKSGHGQGSTPIEVPHHLAAYAVHLAAASILFLVSAFASRSGPPGTRP